MYYPSSLRPSDAVHSYWALLVSLRLVAELALARKLYRAATFSYDGTQYKGSIVQPITPNDLFYCVTKNVVDPKVNVDLWHLEIGGLVQNAATWRFQDLIGFKPTTQETTLMCISNGLDAGLISNAVWKGLPLRDLLDQAGVLSGAARVRLHGVDNYTDTIPLRESDGTDNAARLRNERRALAGSARLSVARDRSRLLRREKCEMAHED